jgi:hypothetical protein
VPVIAKADAAAIAEPPTPSSSHAELAFLAQETSLRVDCKWMQKPKVV